MMRWLLSSKDNEVRRQNNWTVIAKQEKLVTSSCQEHEATQRTMSTRLSMLLLCFVNRIEPYFVTDCKEREL